MAGSHQLDIACPSTENVQVCVHRPQRSVIWASTFTNDVGLVSYRLDVACENEQAYSRRQPRSVIRVVDITHRELRERWEMFTKSQRKQVSETCTTLTSLSALSQEAHGTKVVEREQERRNVQKYNTPENDKSTVTNGGIQDNSRSFPLSHEESPGYVPISETDTPVRSSLGGDEFARQRLDVACENQQVYSTRKPKSVVHVVDITLHELREKWSVFYSKTAVVVQRTSHVRHDSSTTEHMQEHEDAQRHNLPGKVDSRSIDGGVPAIDHGLSKEPSYHEPSRSTALPGQWRLQEIDGDTEPHEEKIGLDAVPGDGYKLDMHPHEDKTRMEIGLDTLPGHEYMLDTQTHEDQTEVDTIPGDHKLDMQHSEVTTALDSHEPHEYETEVQKLPGDEYRVVAQPDEVDTLVQILPGDQKVDMQPSDIITQVKTRIDTEVDTLRGRDDRHDATLHEDVTRVDTLPVDEYRLDMQPVDEDKARADTGLDTQPDEDTTAVDTGLGTLPDDDHRLDKVPDEDRTGLDRGLDTLPGDDHRLDKEPDEDRTGLDRGLDTLRDDDHRLDKEPDEDRTGLDTGGHTAG